MTNPQPKLITGPLHSDNKWASDWGYQGFIGYGCQKFVVVADPKTLQVIQTLGPHRSAVTHVKWAREKYHHAFATGRTYSLILAAGDSAGNILIWDVVTGNIRSEFPRPSVHVRFLELEWIAGHDESHDLLLVLRFPGQLEMWDAYAGAQLWKTDFVENMLSFALDPFNINRLICLSEVTHLVLVSDLEPTKAPQTDRLKNIWYSDPNPVVNNLTYQTKLRGQVPSQDNQHQFLVTDGESSYQHDPARIQFRFFTYKVIPCVTSDMLFCLHDNGSVSVRVRKQNMGEIGKDEALAMTYEQISQSDSMRLLRQVKIVGFSHHPVTESRIAILLSDSKIIMLDTMVTSFHKVESTVQRNRFTLGEMVAGVKIVLPRRRNKSEPEEVILRMVVSGLISGLNYPVTCSCMQLSRATLHEVAQHLAIGSGCGSIQLVNVYTGQVEHEHKLFSSPVRGMQWMRASRLIAFTYTEPASYGNRGVRNEIVILDSDTGQTELVRGKRNNEGPILFVKTSPSGKYMALAVKDKPVEIWNIEAKQLLKQLTDLPNRPNSIAWHPSMTRQLPKKQDGKVNLIEILFIATSNDGVSLSKVTIKDGIVSNLVNFSNEQVFELNPSKTDIHILVWKGTYLLMADKAGQIYFRTQGKNARKIYEKLGTAAKCIRFAPGKQNYKFLVLYEQNVDIWEISDRKVEYITSSPAMTSTLVDASWAGPESVAIVTNDICLHIMTITAKGPVSPVKHAEDDFIHVHPRTMPLSSLRMNNWGISDVFSPALLDRKTAFLLKYSLQCHIEPFNESVEPLLGLVNSGILSAIRDSSTTTDRCLLVARLFGDEYDMEFWQMFKYISKAGKRDTTSLGNLETPFNITDWIAKLLTPTSEVADLLDLSTGDLYANLHSDNLTTVSIDNSWVDGLIKEQDSFIASSIGVKMGNDDYKKYEAARLLLHNKKADCYRAKKVCASRFIMMARTAMATQVLMETETDNMDFRHDCLKLRYTASRFANIVFKESKSKFANNVDRACLASCVEPSSDSIGTLKLAATHLIAAGHLQDGVDMLCLINKPADACKYMVTYGHWLEAVWLAKIRLSEEEQLGLVCKYAVHLWQESQKMKSILVMLSIGQFTTVLRMLISLGQFDTAALFLQACVAHGLLSDTNNNGQVYLEFAKFLLVTQYQSAVEHYCKKAGKSGHSLLEDIKQLDESSVL